MRRLVFILSLLILPMLTHAATSTDLQRSGIIEPAEVIRSGIETLVSYMEQKKQQEPAEMALYLDQNIAPYFDFKRMASWSAGRSYRYMNKQERARLTQDIRSDFMNILAARLSGYSGSQIEYLKPRGNLDRGNVVLGVKIHTGNRYPLRLDFKLYQGEQSWKVYDVVANGASAVSHYRNDFARRFRQQRMRNY